jgi:hypothetical protein
MISAIVAPTGHSPELLCAADMATIPAQLAAQKVHPMSTVAITSDRLMTLHPTIRTD